MVRVIRVLRPLKAISNLSGARMMVRALTKLQFPSKFPPFMDSASHVVRYWSLNRPAAEAGSNQSAETNTNANL
jgi:hypothetical protein